MATLRDIRGTNIPIRASDPANPQVGEVWYNTTTHALKAQVLNATGSFATSGNLNVGRYALGNFGTPAAGNAIDGNTHPVGAPDNLFIKRRTTKKYVDRHGNRIVR